MHGHVCRGWPDGEPKRNSPAKARVQGTSALMIRCWIIQFRYTQSLAVGYLPSRYHVRKCRRCDILAHLHHTASPSPHTPACRDRQEPRNWYRVANLAIFARPCADNSAQCQRMRTPVFCASSSFRRALSIRRRAASAPRCNSRSPSAVSTPCSAGIRPVASRAALRQTSLILVNKPSSMPTGPRKTRRSTWRWDAKRTRSFLRCAAASCPHPPHPGSLFLLVLLLFYGTASVFGVKCPFKRHRPPPSPRAPLTRLHVSRPAPSKKLRFLHIWNRKRKAKGQGGEAERAP